MVVNVGIFSHISFRLKNAYFSKEKEDLYIESSQNPSDSQQSECSRMMPTRNKSWNRVLLEITWDHVQG